MEQAVPVIFAPPTKLVRITLYSRVVALGVAFACSMLVYTAWRLRPSPDGVGTHTDLGYQSCNMLATTGVPCPTCGMTTSFAWFYKGNLAASFYVQPAGFVVAYLTGMLLLLGLYEAFTGRPIHRLLRFFSGKLLMILGAAIFIAGWGWKIAIHSGGIDGWR